MLEKEIENQILGFLRAIGIMCWKNQSTGIYDPTKRTFRKPSKYQINGVSDILGVIGGRFLAIEVKTEKGRLTDDQRAFIAKINNEGGIAFVTRSLENCLEQLLKFFPDNLYIKQALQNRGHDVSKHN